MTTVEEVQESLEHAIRVLAAIVEDIKKGDYNPDKGMEDVENLLWTEGLDFMSVLADYAETGIACNFEEEE